MTGVGVPRVVVQGVLVQGVLVLGLPGCTGPRPAMVYWSCHGVLVRARYSVLVRARYSLLVRARIDGSRPH